MSIAPSTVLISLTAVLSATVGGLYFGFSSFVLAGLDRTQPATATAAMRGINAAAVSSAPFLVVFGGSALLAVLVGGLALQGLGRPGSWLLLAGALLVVAGTVVTVAANVPLNDRLQCGDIQWDGYLAAWSAWNHVRTATSLAGAVVLVLGLRYRG